MSKKEKKIVPKYEYVEEEGSNEVAPIRRKIAKTMEITETFTFYDALAYCMKMEKAIEDKKAEIAGLQSMVDAYREEIVLIEEQLGVESMESAYQLELHEKLKQEEAIKNGANIANEIINEENVQGN